MPKKKIEKEDNKKGYDNLLDKAIDLLKEKHKGLTIVEKLSSVKERPIRGYSTGSIGLDYIISSKSGGMEEGRVIELWGDFSTGKTTIALCLCANVTANGKKVIFVDAENSFRWDLACNVGVDTELFYLLDKADARTSANILMELVQTGEVGCVVIDSVAAWRPLPEGTKSKPEDIDITKDKIGNQAQFLSKTLPVLSWTCRQHGTVLVLLNQTRENFGTWGSFGLKPYGGKSEEHQNNVRLKLKGKADQRDYGILDSNTDELIGQKIKVKCDKNKLDMPFKETEVPLILGQGVNPFIEVADLATKFGIVERGGSWYKLEGENLCQGLNNLYQLLYDDLSIFYKIRNKLIELLEIKYQEDKVIFNKFIRDKEDEQNS